MISAGSKVSWKVEGFPDATGKVVKIDEVGVLIDDSDGSEEGGMIYKDLKDLTEVK